MKLELEPEAPPPEAGSESTFSAKRVLLEQPPFVDRNTVWNRRGHWPAHWISHQAVHDGQPCFVAYRLALDLDKPQQVRIHVTADERYELYLDGQRIGRGSERGDLNHWFFESYDLWLAAGRHVLVARVWWLGRVGPAPYAQAGARPAFLLAAEGELAPVLTTGVADWTCRTLGGHELLPTEMAWAAGAKLRVDGAQFPWGFEQGNWETSEAPAAVAVAVGSDGLMLHPGPWTLTPATLPPMLEQPLRVGVVRHVEAVDDIQTRLRPVVAANHLASEVEPWDAMLRGEGSVEVPAQTWRRVIIDLQEYYTAYPRLLVSGGGASLVRIHWAESLYLDPQLRDGCMVRDPVFIDSEGRRRGILARHKGQRDQVEGKCFVGIGDEFVPDGGPSRRFETLWWESGRYLELMVKTAAEPLTIHELVVVETRYPLESQISIACSEPRLAAAAPIMRRALECCSHETYMDCPYYEQLMYVGDTRLEALSTYAISSDDRLARKAIALFDGSRFGRGLTRSRHPSSVPQVIPPFSLWWVAMVHDYALWRDDPAFVRRHMTGVRAVLEAFRTYLNRDGLVQAPDGWNVTDWVGDWPNGVPPAAERGVSSIINFHYVLALRQAAQLEHWHGEPELAALDERLARTVAAAADALFWDEPRDLYADDPEHQHFSEHAQCLALLAGAVPAGQRERLATSLFDAGDLARATIYFSHYLFEACRELGQVQRMWPRLDLWFDHLALGLRTTMESPEPTRSDCHAWGAHPLFHFPATILGIRPAGPGFGSVVIQPQLGPLTWATGQWPHRLGAIRVALQREKGHLKGQVQLPPGLSGQFIYDGQTRSLSCGTQWIDIQPSDTR